MKIHKYMKAYVDLLAGRNYKKPWLQRDINTLRDMISQGWRGTTPDALKDLLRRAENRLMGQKIKSNVVRGATAVGIIGAGYGGYRAAHNYGKRTEKIACYICKTAGEINEPTPEEHASAPEQKLRPRAEVIIYNKDGIWGIKKDGYLLLPGGGIPEGEKPQEAAVREALEEADRVCFNIEARDTASAIYDPDVFKFREWDGEKTYFFMAVDGGPGEMRHKDKEDFKVIPYDEALSYLNDLCNDKKQEWALNNNKRRIQIIKDARRNARIKDGLTPRKYASINMDNVYEKIAWLQAGKIIPKNRFFQPLRNGMARMYKTMRKTPLGSDAARLLYDNVEILPHQVLTGPIPIYSSTAVSGAYSLIRPSTRAAKLRTLKHMGKLTADQGKKTLGAIADGFRYMGNVPNYDRFI